MSDDASTDFEIVIQNLIEAENLPEDRIARAIRYVLAAHQVATDTALSVVIESDDAVRILNQQYRGVDKVTDILSFPADPLPEEVEEKEAPYLGDLIIAYPYTAQQAAEAGHALDDELVLLVVHGTLHLLGYDHDTEVHQDAMWAAQAEALAAMGAAISVPRFTFDDEIHDATPGDTH